MSIQNRSIFWGYILSTLILLICMSVLYILINSFTINIKGLVYWKQQHPILRQSNFTVEQQIYYKLFLKIIREDAPYKTETEVDLLATLLVAYSKHTPYFAGVMYTEGFRTGWWKKGKRMRAPQAWCWFSQKNDGGSPSYGLPKIKWVTIKAVCRARKERAPLSPKKMDIHDVEWQIKIIDWAAYHFDGMVKRYKNNPIKAIAAYKYGTGGYRSYKRKNPYTEPYTVSGEAIVKATEYLKRFSEYTLKGEGKRDGKR